MPGSTSRNALPYPVGTDTVDQGPAVIQSLAEATERRLHYTEDFGSNTMGRRAYNLCSYSETVSNGTGYMVIQTNILATSTIMSTLFITGLVYEPDNAMVDIQLKFYPFTDGVQHRWEVIRKGSFHCDVQIWVRNSDQKVAIVMTPLTPAAYWNYPKLTVDGIFGHTSTAESFMEGWKIFRTNSMSGYTVKQSTAPNRPSAEDTGWINMPFINGWTQYSPGGGWDCQYRRKGGIVYMRGLGVAPADIYQPMAIMPVGFRPLNNTLRGVVDSGQGKRMLYIYSNGTVQFPNGASTGWAGVEGVNYPAHYTT